MSPKAEHVAAERGQALVEAVLTLPLSLFLILGTMQLFLMQQARIMTEYAAMRAARSGSVNFGNCRSMTHAAIGAVLPTFARTDTPQKLGQSFFNYSGNTYGQLKTSAGTPYSGSIVWIFRNVVGTNEEFDTTWSPERIQVRLVFWYPLRIPFADWVITKMMLAHYGIQAYTAANPLMPTQKANWSGSGGFVPAEVGEFQRLASNGEYVFPLEAKYAMRMMTPTKFTGDCL